jgi:signal transduction histidine kinase
LGNSDKPGQFAPTFKNGLKMASSANKWFRNLSIEAKMLAIILPLVAIPMIVLGSVGYAVSSGQAATSGARYLKERASDLYTIGENPSIRDYFENRYYGLLEEAEVYRQDIEHSLLRFVERINRNELIYRQVRYVDNQGLEIAKLTDGAIDPNRTDVSTSTFFQAVKQLPNGGMYASPASAAMTYALPVYDTSGGERKPTLLGAMVVDFAYPIDDFQRSARLIAISFFIITAATLAGGLLLTVNRVRRLTRPIRRLANAADQIAAGRRDIVVDVGTGDEVGRLAQSFTDMAAALKWNEEALKRKIAEATALYEIGQEISAQVSLEPTLELIVKRARALLKSDISMLALHDDHSDEFVIRAQTGEGSAALAGTRIQRGQGLGGRVIASGHPHVVDDYIEEYGDSPFLLIIKQTSMKSFLAVPLKSEHEVSGVLYVMSAISHKFQDEDMQLLIALATQATISINNARLYQQVRHHAEELETRIGERTKELRQLNQQLEQASRHKSEFLANMSHELRTPMNAIIGFTKLVMRRSKEQLPQKQYENLQKSLSSAEHLLTLINQILDLSKIEAGRLEVYAGRFHLQTVLEECIRTVEPMIKQESVELSSDVAVDLPDLYSDRDKLKQIVLNLLSNAIKFTERGQIRLAAKGDKDWIAINVADTGPGIPRDRFDFIFEEFRQMDGGATRQHGGTGLGLSISRHLAHLLGGDIFVDSVVGQGSTFTIRVPTTLHAAGTAESDEVMPIAETAGNAAP